MEEGIKDYTPSVEAAFDAKNNAAFICNAINSTNSKYLVDSTSNGLSEEKGKASELKEQFTNQKSHEDKTHEFDNDPPAKRLKILHRKHSSPKKRMNVPFNIKKKEYIYGNYSRYYGYRNLQEHHDVRLDVFVQHKSLFEDKEILDIGCNTGLVTMEIAKHFNIKQITGLDIDKSLINKAVKYIHKAKKNFVGNNRASFPFNINFVHGSYVLIDDVLLELETEQFDLVLCLSLTKWIHLNFGDSGLKQAFKRIFLQLRPGGKLILEAQPWLNYKRRKRLTPGIFENYKGIKFLPKDFANYLLGHEVGFSEVCDLGVPRHCVEGFRRPIQVFTKAGGADC